MSEMFRLFRCLDTTAQLVQLISLCHIVQFDYRPQDLYLQLPPPPKKKYSPTHNKPYQDSFSFRKETMANSARLESRIKDIQCNSEHTMSYTPHLLNKSFTLFLPAVGLFITFPQCLNFLKALGSVFETNGCDCL